MVTVNDSRLGCRRPSGPLTAEEKRLYKRIPESVDHVSHRSFASERAEDRLFGTEAERIEVPAWTYFPAVPEDMPRARSAKARLTARQEEQLFLRYNYACYRLGRLIRAQRRRASRVRARQMLLWFSRMTDTREKLARANMALVVAMAKRTRIPNVEFGELISEGNMAMLRSIEKFDVSRGFKFSTYACRAILKGFNRMATKTGRYRSRFPTEFDPVLDRSDDDATRRQAERQDAVDELRYVLRRNRAGLSRAERKVIVERFALGAGGRPKTLSEVGKLVGLTNERVRQIQNLALGKLRAALDDSDKAA